MEKQKTEKLPEKLGQKNQKIDDASKKQEAVKIKPEEKIIPEKQKVSEMQTENEQKTAKIKKQETQKKEVQKVKKDKANVNIEGAPISTKYSRDICRFIKNKPLDEAIKDLEQVLIYKKAIPMRGGYGHKKSAKGFASGSGKYPQNAAKYFIKLLKNLSANASANGLENPIITEAFANTGSKPRARFGRWQRKRTHIKLTAREKNMNKKIKNKEKKQK